MKKPDTVRRYIENIMREQLKKNGKKRRIIGKKHIIAKRIIELVKLQNALFKRLFQVSVKRKIILKAIVLVIEKMRARFENNGPECIENEQNLRKNCSQEIKEVAITGIPRFCKC